VRFSRIPLILPPGAHSAFSLQGGSMQRSFTPPAETTPSWASGARRRIPFYLLTALLLALLAAVVTFIYLEQLRASMIPTATALVARQAIRPGETITEAMVEVRAVPEGIVPIERLTSVSQATGRTVLVPLAADEVVLPQRLGGASEAGLSRRLPDGRWAMVLPGPWLASAIPEIGLGDRIDLLAYQAGQPVNQAAVIVSALEVLAVAGKATEAEALTLAVGLEEAAAIMYARANGFLLLPLLRPSGG
jgi:Flp pilus assembly protein CpaB